jgi:hypothetical protein
MTDDWDKYKHAGLTSYEGLNKYIVGATGNNPKYADEDPDAGIRFLPAPTGDAAAFFQNLLSSKNKKRKRKQGLAEGSPHAPGGPGGLLAPRPGGQVPIETATGPANPRSRERTGDGPGLLGNLKAILESGQGGTGSSRLQDIQDQALLNQTEFGPEGEESDDFSLAQDADVSRTSEGGEAEAFFAALEQGEAAAAEQAAAIQREMDFNAEEDDANQQFLEGLGVRPENTAEIVETEDGGFSTQFTNEDGSVSTVVVPAKYTSNLAAASRYEESINAGLSPEDAAAKADAILNAKPGDGALGPGEGIDPNIAEGSPHAPGGPGGLFEPTGPTPDAIEGQLKNFAQTFGFDEGAFDDMFQRASEGTFTATDRAGLERALFNAKGQIPAPVFDEDGMETPSSVALRSSATDRLEDFGTVIGQITELSKSARRGMVLKNFFPNFDQKQLRNLPDSLVKGFYDSQEAQRVAAESEKRSVLERGAQGTALSPYFPDIDPEILQNLPSGLITALFKQLQFDQYLKRGGGSSFGGGRGISVPTGGGFEF